MIIIMSLFVEWIDIVMMVLWDMCVKEGEYVISL